jgi:hypothetical protein
MNKERILLLANVIENATPPAKHPNLTFEMSSFWWGPEDEGFSPAEEGYHTCGTTACIAGWAVALFTEEEASEANIPMMAQDVLELTYQQADSLFIPELSRRYEDITPAIAAQVLRRFAETGLIDWEVVTE